MSRIGINEQNIREILVWVNEEKATREEMEVCFLDDNLQVTFFFRKIFVLQIPISLVISRF